MSLDDTHGVKLKQEKVAPPLSFASPVPFDLALPTDSFLLPERVASTSFDEVTFDHLFQPSFDVTEVSPLYASPWLPSQHRAVGSVRTDPNDGLRWLGWTWSPLGNDFESQTPPLSSDKTSPALERDGLFVTPARQVCSKIADDMQTLRPSDRRTTPRIMHRTRPVSDRHAYQELVQCVHMSARKRINTHGRRALGLGATQTAWADLHARTVPTSHDDRDTARPSLSISSGTGVNTGTSKPSSPIRGGCLVDITRWHQDIEAKYEVNNSNAILYHS